MRVAFGMSRGVGTKLKYTTAQIAAIKDVQHNTRITASAGAGKTGVTTGRVVKCLLTKGVDPRNIVVCAYNEDAAAVLSTRIPDLIAEKVGAVDGLAEMFVGTLHSFCLGILQDECYRFRKHSVLSEVANRLLVSRYPCESGLHSAVHIGGKKEGQALSGEPNEVRAYLDALNVLREERVLRERLPAGLRDALDSYHRLLDAKGFLDYTRIQVEVLSALTDTSHPDNIAVQRRLAARIKYLLIDEYQDCNAIQEAIIARLQRLGATLTVCGDEDQTCMRSVARTCAISRGSPNATPTCGNTSWPTISDPQRASSRRPASSPTASVNWTPAASQNPCGRLRPTWSGNGGTCWR